MTDLYETLGVARDVDASTIKAAYRKCAQATHPDREGGDKQAFQDVQTAYDVLSDPERRARYDATGQFAGQVADKRATMLAQVADLLMQMIDAVDVKHTDIVAAAITKVSEGSHALKHQLSSVERQIARKRDVLGRLSGGSDSIVQTMLESAIRQHEDIVTQINGAIARNEEVIELLKEYTYRVDPLQKSQYAGQQNGDVFQNQYQNSTTARSWGGVFR